MVVLAVALAAFGVACLGTRGLIAVLRRAAILDRPNERSSHVVPTPRGGGIAVIGAIVIAWLALIVAGVLPPFPLAAALLGAALLGLVSWRDDLRSLPAAARFAAQAVAIVIALAAVAFCGAPLSVLPWLPTWLGGVVTAVSWLWFVNLFNFMDGIDGLAGSEAAAIALGLVLFASVGIGEHIELVALAAPIAAAALGFLVWNWMPARIFLGDVGSVPLGYLLGFLLLGVAAEGYWRIALILPLYFLADATITLLRRLLRREKVWQAHREHFYQKAVQRGLPHAAVVRRVILADIALIGLGFASENGWGLKAVVLACFVVAVLLTDLSGLLTLRVQPIPAAKTPTPAPTQEPP